MIWRRNGEGRRGGLCEDAAAVAARNAAALPPYKCLEVQSVEDRLVKRMGFMLLSY